MEMEKKIFLALLICLIFVIIYFGFIKVIIQNDKNTSFDDTNPIKVEDIQSDKFNLVIITPREFSHGLIPLVNHKNNYGVKTSLITLDRIYDSFSGRDNAEKIKFFIKYALEEWNISFVLLIGDIKKLPIRKTYASPWEDYLLSDLYYADIYDENENFCSWDSNNNSKFGEVLFNGDEGTSLAPKCRDCYNNLILKMVEIDKVDLYPDVSIGRLPCSNLNEVEIVVNKIITYECKTYEQSWFKKIILIGGDDHPEFAGYEGEVATAKVAKQLPDFEKEKLWTSNKNFNAITVNRAINKGAGFISYSGHGFEYGLGTYRPDPVIKRMIKYYNFYTFFLRNKNKLPIIFFDACLTARLDFSFNDIISQKPWKFLKILTILPNINEDSLLKCFAWKFICKRNGGAVATIGSTRNSYSYISGSGLCAGGSSLNINFFKSYYEGVTLGEMFTQAQKDYIDNVLRDYLTLEEFLLLGDPSLKVGGYQ